MKTLVILGSARGDSNTLAAVRKLCPYPDYELVDLRELRIEAYDYDQARNEDDDFAAVARKMQEADHIVFASPVYWYAMSGQMKVFFDRLTDLTGRHKAIGRSLKDKKAYLIASGASPALPEEFVTPFQRTAEYFDMEFVSALYHRS